VLGVGSVIGGRFRVEQILGAGGMGVVVAATHLELGHRVAIKLLRDEMAQSPVIVERFLREAKAVVGLRTEHVCRVTDTGRLDTGAPYIVMEMLEGVDLQRTIARSPLPLTTAVEYVLQACVALAEAHAAGIIHRDLKPANLFVTRRLDGGPLVKVLDFGIAKAFAETGAHLTHQSAMGTPGYMSPEQIQSARDVDARTDIWALGVTLYQLLSTRLPFGGTNATDIAISVATDPPQPLDVPPALHAVIWKCLEKRPADRYANLGELMVALAPFGGPTARQHLAQAAALGSPVTAPSMPVVAAITQATQVTGIPPTKSTGVITIPRKRRSVLLIALVLFVVVGGAAGWMALHQSSPAPPPPPPRAADAARVAVAPAVVIDAAPVVDAYATPDAEDASVAETVAAVDAGVKQAHRTKNDIWAQIDEVNKTFSDPKKLAEMCKGYLMPQAAAFVPIGMRMRCACVTKNQKLAKDLITAFPEEQRSEVRAQCKTYGVTIP